MKPRRKIKRSRLLKQFRRQAERDSVGMPYVEYQTNNAKGTQVLTDNCTRAKYKVLKRASDVR